MRRGGFTYIRAMKHRTRKQQARSGAPPSRGHAQEPEPKAESEFKRALVDRFDGLPPQQRVIGDYLLEHLKEIPFLSVPELSSACGASEATIVRFAQRLGYDGFSGLKTALSDSLREKVVRPDAHMPGADALSHLPKDDTLVAVAELEIRNIQASVQNLDRAVFADAALALMRADHVYTFGIGISAFLCELLTYLLTQLGLRATTLSNKFSSPLEQIGALRPSDMLVVFSFPPYSRHTLEMVREAAAHGIPTAAICDRLTAPVARHARFILPVRTDNLMFTNAFAATSVLLNALATETASRHRGQAAEAVSRISRILADDPNLVRD